MKDRKKLTVSQVAALRPFEENLETAVRSDWTRGLLSDDLRLMARIHKEVAGGSTYIDLSCPYCVLTLVRTVGKWYIADKDNPDPDTVEAPAPAKPARKRKTVKKGA